MYDFAPLNESSATRPPCFWNCGTAAGLVLNTRHGALPAVIAAPMTSSEDLPAGISWAVTFSLGWAEVQSVTIALPQAISSGLFDSHTLIGPVADVALLSLEPPPQAAVSPSARTAADRDRTFVLMSAPFGPAAVDGTAGRCSRAGGGRPRGRAHDQARLGQQGGAGRLAGDQLQQPGGGGTPPGDDVGADAGEPRLQVGGDLHVVVAGDRELPGHVEAERDGQGE